MAPVQHGAQLDKNEFCVENSFEGEASFCNKPPSFKGLGVGGALLIRGLH